MPADKAALDVFRLSPTPAAGPPVEPLFPKLENLLLGPRFMFTLDYLLYHAPLLRRLEIVAVDAHDAMNPSSERFDEDPAFQRIVQSGCLKIVLVVLTSRRISKECAGHAVLMERRVLKWSLGRCRLQWTFEAWDRKETVEFDTRQVDGVECPSKFEVDD